MTQKERKPGKRIWTFTEKCVLLPDVLQETSKDIFQQTDTNMTTENYSNKPVLMIEEQEKIENYISRFQVKYL
jgi:hypothetical protein